MSNNDILYIPSEFSYHGQRLHDHFRALSQPTPDQVSVYPKPPGTGRSYMDTNTSTAGTSESLYSRNGQHAGRMISYKYKNLRCMIPEYTGEIEKPWLSRRDPLKRISYALTLVLSSLGIIVSFVYCYISLKNINFVGNVCLVMDEDFSNGLDPSRWVVDVNMGGFGNGEFEMTTNSSENIFVEDGVLYLTPTITSDEIGSTSIFNGYTYNITGCTSSDVLECAAVSNSTLQTAINPVKSARISTINSTSIRYGRVEVVARIPEGDWLWPAIWMLPKENVYGTWPMSGEIDIMESRGNDARYIKQGRNYVRSSLNWGPTKYINSVEKTYGWQRNRRSTYADGFHTYTLEWTDKFIRAYVDNRNKAMINIPFNEPFFKRGNYPEVVMNGTTEILLKNPWEISGNNAAPFDQDFYLIMNVAAGGTNGWFPDGYGNKPWLDGDTNAMYEFAEAQNEWYSTWPSDPRKRGMAVSSVKMWQKC